MKKTLIILSVLLISLSVKSQVIPKDTVRVLVGTRFDFVKSYNNFVTSQNPPPIKKDSIVYKFPYIPEFNKRNSDINERAEVIGDTLYVYKNNAVLFLTYNRRLLLFQLVEKYINVYNEKPEPDKLLLYLKYAKNNKVSNKEFFGNSNIVNILNKTEIINDTIK